MKGLFVERKSLHLVWAFLLLVSIMIGALTKGPVAITFMDVVELFFGESSSELHQQVIFNLRLPKIITAVLAGGGLAVSGLVLQTWFRNFLADPFLLGINSGSSLFVAFCILGMDYFLITDSSLIRSIGILGAGIIGAILSLLLILSINKLFSNSVYLIIFGLIFSYFCNGVINLLLVYGGNEEIRSFLLWSLGSFQRVPLDHLFLFVLLILLCGVILYSFANIFNIVLLGRNYAASLGVDTEKYQVMIIPLVGLISAIVGVYCGPIVFVGMMAPHMTKLWLRTSDHRLLLPCSFILGGILALGAEFISSSLFKEGIPINSILGILGAPFLLFLLLRSRFAEGGNNA